MSRYLKVTTRPVPGREEEFLDWYVGTHLGEVTQVPGFRTGRLFRTLTSGGEHGGGYTALYEVDPAIGIGELLGALNAAVPSMRMSDALDPASAEMTFLDEA